MLKAMSGELNIRSYFQTRMATLGYTEWTDEFIWQNIPSTKLETIYHLENFEGNLEGMGHNVARFKMPVTLRCFIQGRADPKAFHTIVLDKIGSIMKAVCNMIQVSAQSYIKLVEPSSFSHGPIEETNDNIFMIEIKFNCLVVFDLNA
jgi:hypothetical protein